MALVWWTTLRYWVLGVIVVSSSFYSWANKSLRQTTTSSRSGPSKKTPDACSCCRWSICRTSRSWDVVHPSYTPCMYFPVGNQNFNRICMLKSRSSEPRWNIICLLRKAGRTSGKLYDTFLNPKLHMYPPPLSITSIRVVRTLALALEPWLQTWPLLCRVLQYDVLVGH